MSQTDPALKKLSKKPPGNGPLILGLTGAVLALLTVAGAVLNYLLPLALWVDIWLAVAVSGLVGFGTNWIAIKMLFHPRVRVMGVQGVIPSRRADLAKAVAATIEQHLISADRMHKLLVDSGAVSHTLETLTGKLPDLLANPTAKHLAHNEVRRLIQQAVGTVSVEARAAIKKKLRSTGLAVASGAAATAAFGPLAGLLAVGAAKSGMMDPVVDRLLNDMVDELQNSGALDSAAADIVSQMPQAATGLLRNTELKARLTEMVSGASETLLKSIDVRGLIETELLAHDDAELEALIDSVASNELVFIQVIGGGLGMIAGFSLIWPWLLLPFGAAFALAWLVGRRAEIVHERTKKANASAASSVRASIEKTAELAAAAPAACLTEVIEIDVIQRENAQTEPIEAEFVSKPE